MHCANIVIWDILQEICYIFNHSYYKESSHFCISCQFIYFLKQCLERSFPKGKALLERHISFYFMWPHCVAAIHHFSLLLLQLQMSCCYSQSCFLLAMDINFFFPCHIFWYTILDSCYTPVWSSLAAVNAFNDSSFLPWV